MGTIEIRQKRILANTNGRERSEGLRGREREERSKIEEGAEDC